MSEFIFKVFAITGWLINVAFTVKWVANHLRYQSKLTIETSIASVDHPDKQEYLCVAITNSGRRPVNLTFAGFLHNERIMAYEQIELKLGKAYKDIPKVSVFPLALVREICRDLKELGHGEAKGIGYYDENGKKYKGYWTDDIKKTIFG